jgi:hypothetical protein
LLIGQTGVNRSHPDFYPLYLGNHIFGGSGLTAILSGEIREKKGLAYSVYSHFSKMQSNGSFIIKLQTKNSQANEAKKIGFVCHYSLLFCPTLTTISLSVLIKRTKAFWISCALISLILSVKVSK